LRGRPDSVFSQAASFAANPSSLLGRGVVPDKPAAQYQPECSAWVTFRANQHALYECWTIESLPTILARQRLFVSGVIVSRGDKRFIITDLGNRVYRWQAYERDIEWAKQWIDNNYRLAAHKPAST
jgi:hypothetical protein